VSEPATNPATVADSTQLALLRTRLAYERTLMAWIRVAISLISFGFTIYKFFQYVREEQGAQVQPLVGPRVFGMRHLGYRFHNNLRTVLAPDHTFAAPALAPRTAGNPLR